MAHRLIPAFVNPDSGNAKASQASLAGHPGFDVRLIPAANLIPALRDAVRAGEPRVLVAGGDGTLATAASVLAGTGTALAVLPGGTLNHFARDHGIPTDHDQALELAVRGPVAPIDVGYLNRQLFLNTSSVGAYVKFVETRDRLERYFGYWLASVAAGWRILRALRPIRVTLEVEGEQRIYDTYSVVIAVGERSLKPPGLGRPTGRRGGALHVVVARGRRGARRMARAYARRDRDLPGETKPLGFDSVLADRLRLDLPMTQAKIGCDGEIKRMQTPLEYRLKRDALLTVLPED